MVSTNGYMFSWGLHQIIHYMHSTNGYMSGPYEIVEGGRPNACKLDKGGGGGGMSGKK